MSWLGSVAIGLGATLTGLSMLLMVFGILSYQRVGHKRMLWIAGAFALFAALGVMFTVEAWQSRSNPSLPPEPLLGLGIILALYFAVLKDH